MAAGFSSNTTGAFVSFDETYTWFVDPSVTYANPTTLNMDFTNRPFFKYLILYFFTTKSLCYGTPYVIDQDTGEKSFGKVVKKFSENYTQSVYICMYPVTGVKMQLVCPPGVSPFTGSEDNWIL